MERKRDSSSACSDAKGRLAGLEGGKRESDEEALDSRRGLVPLKSRMLPLDSKNPCTDSEDAKEFIDKLAQESKRSPNSTPHPP